MLLILAVGQVLQVAGVVVALLSVAVVDFMLRGTGADERGCHETVDVMMFVMAQVHEVVPTGEDAVFPDSTCARVSHTAAIGNLVQSLEPLYGAPPFHRLVMIRGV
jgi:hypothetical protein